MTQEERAETAEEALQYERLRKQGVTLTEIGVSRAKGINLEESMATEGQGQEKSDTELNEKA